MKRIGMGIILLLLLGVLNAPAAASEVKSIVRLGSDVTIEAGQKALNVTAIGGQITVMGTVENNVVAIGGSVVLTRTAVVGGSVTSVGGVIVMARGAEVNGNLTEINSSNLQETLTTALSSEWEGWSWVFAIISLSIFLVILVLALLIAALLPKPVRVVSEAITENTFKVVLCGLLGLVLISPLAILLTISVVGIALIPLEVIVVVCSILLGFIAVGRIIGGWFLRLIRHRAGMIRETLWGLILLWMIGWIPYLGWMIKAVAIVIGLGAALVTRFGTYQGWKCEQTCPVPGTDPRGENLNRPLPPPPPGSNGQRGADPAPTGDSPTDHRQDPPSPVGGSEPQ
ncbi:MAG: polymer-forming cytoskeletal protein [Deltaproteobacteria bacterium]|nr:polymer-forming cytoskeletal protein [Deltaproteobacteria bacterium]